MTILKTVGIIPARLNSSRFPRKLLHPLKDKSVIEHTLLKAQTFSVLDDLFVATDSLEIAQIAKQNDVKVIMTSSQPISGTDRIREAVLSNASLQNVNILVNLQEDHPFTSEKTVASILALLNSDPFAEVATAAVPLHDKERAESPDIVKCVFDHYQNALYFSRSLIPYQADTYYHHIGIYAYRKRFLMRLSDLKQAHLEKCEDLEQLRFLENGIRLKVALSEDPAQGVDQPKDILRCEKLLCP